MSKSLKVNNEEGHAGIEDTSVPRLPPPSTAPETAVSSPPDGDLLDQRVPAWPPPERPSSTTGPLATLISSDRTQVASVQHQNSMQLLPLNRLPHDRLAIEPERMLLASMAFLGDLLCSLPRCSDVNSGWKNRGVSIPHWPIRNQLVSDRVHLEVNDQTID